MAGSVRAVCYPRIDAAFVARVEHLVQVRDPDDGEPVRAAIEALLRTSYPLAVISARRPMAALDDEHVWYVFRDGSVLETPDGTTDADGTP